MDYTFNTDIACKIGVEKAVMLHNLHFWIAKNIANNTSFFDGNYWTYNSIKAYGKLFPFWTEKQIRTILDKLEKDGYIIVGNHNKSTYDRTKWYALTEKAFALYGESICPNGQMHLTKKANASDQMVKSNLPNSQMELPKQSNRFDSEGEPIPYSKPYINTDKEREKNQGLKNVIEKFQNDIHPLSSQFEAENLIDLVNTYSSAAVIAAIDIARKNHGMSIKYIATILLRSKRGENDAIKWAARIKQNQNKERDITTSKAANGFNTRIREKYEIENDKLWESLPRRL